MVAVTVAVPAETPVTTPSATVATVVSLDSHSTSASEGLVVAVMVPVPAITTLTVAGESSMVGVVSPVSPRRHRHPLLQEERR